LNNLAESQEPHKGGELPRGRRDKNIHTRAQKASIERKEKINRKEN
jgi:hypothetical protein